MKLKRGYSGRKFNPSFSTTFSLRPQKVKTASWGGLAGIFLRPSQTNEIVNAEKTTNANKELIPAKGIEISSKTNNTRIVTTNLIVILPLLEVDPSALKDGVFVQEPILNNIIIKSICQDVDKQPPLDLFLYAIIEEFNYLQMEQYPIPQFIEQEGKIAFFISFRQFIYLVAGGIASFFFYFLLPFALFVLCSFFAMVIAAILAFVQVNGVPILNIILSSVGFAMGGKDYTWKKKESPYPFKSIKRARIEKINEGPVLKAQTSRLKKTHTDVELRTR